MNIEPISVHELNSYIKSKIDSDEYLNTVYVAGEISNCKIHYTGHIYFTLKDESSLIKCVMFKSYTSHLTFTPKDGMKVNVLGSIQVFERDGIYQLYAKAMKENGAGTLYEQFEKLKAELEKKGLFAQSHKKPIPQYPKEIGVLTSSTGSVIKDIINVSTRRNKNVHIKLYPVPVQGKGAELQIGEGIKYFNEHKNVDVIIIARGGGSLEDLWPFNEESLAYEIYNSEIPIISAVGHETDYSISDFVADLRAPTPSAAAELAVPNIDDVLYTISLFENRLKVALKKKIEVNKLKYEKCMSLKCFKDPTYKINERRIVLDNCIKELLNKQKLILMKKQKSYIEINTKLDALSPLKTMARGYSLVVKDNKIIKDGDMLKKDDIIDINFYKNKKSAKIL